MFNHCRIYDELFALICRRCWYYYCHLVSLYGEKQQIRIISVAWTWCTAWNAMPFCAVGPVALMWRAGYGRIASKIMKYVWDSLSFCRAVVINILAIPVKASCEERSIFISFRMSLTCFRNLSWIIYYWLCAVYTRPVLIIKFRLGQIMWI